MKSLGYVLLACLVLAVVKAVVAALLIALVGGLFWLAATRPREIAGLIGLAIVAGLIRDHGLAFLTVIGIALVVGAFRQPTPASDQRVDEQQRLG